MESVDFARSQEAANIINAWCANVTKNHIKDVVSPGLYYCSFLTFCEELSIDLFVIYDWEYIDDVAHAVIMLINTVYFNGIWSEPFVENDADAQIFWLNSKTKTGNFYYGESIELDAKMLRLPYKVNLGVFCLNSDRK